ncbi:vWA domain-containing protein [Sporichthya polymorpha]|uniref:vWA domain-containing protein n=1 Tax=Sporichthya polymorpha TaxID=35751 RepID=UPI000365F8DF|nr:VWA domain-containing protein [Sporichthya polymorpha]
MKLNAMLDVAVVAHEAEDEVTVLVDLEAPAAPVDTTRAPASLQVVLDRSGSMAGPPLEGAKAALVALIRRLEPTDNFGLVTFDDSAQVVVAAGPLTDKEGAIRAVESVHSGGTTDLSAGYLRGLRELRRVAASGTVLVVSDGHVNAGLSDVDEFAAVTAKAYADGVVTSTLGYGRGYDETLLAAIARAGSGNHVFADNPDAAGAAIAGEVDGLLNKVVQAASLIVTVEDPVVLAHLYNDLPTRQISANQLMIELGDFFGAEGRRVLMKFRVPGMAALGPARIATLELAYVELPGLIEHVVTLPISVNVVPGDEAAGRVPHPTVRSEALFQEAQESKRRASEALERGDVGAGEALFEEARARLHEALPIAPAGLDRDIRAELDTVDAMGGMVHDLGSAYVAKLSRDSHHQMNRKRGRAPRMGSSE